MSNCLFRNKFRKDLNQFETLCYDTLTGLPVDCSTCQSCPDNESCWQDQFIEGGLDNTGTSFVHTNQIFTVTFNDGTTGTFNIASATGWTDQVTQMATGLSGLMPDAVAVEPFCTSGCGGLNAPILDLPRMVARYVGFRVCEGVPYPTSVFYTSDQNTAGRELVLDFKTSEIIYLDRCSSCDPDVEAVWTIATGDDAGMEHEPICPRPCGSPALDSPTSACTFNLVEVCDADFPNDTTYIQFADCGDGEVVNGYLILDADGGLEPYTPAEGAIGPCGTEISSTIQCDSCGNQLEVVVYDDGVVLYYAYSEKGGRGELTYPIGDIGKCEDCTGKVSSTVETVVCIDDEPCNAYTTLDCELNIIKTVTADTFEEVIDPVFAKNCKCGDDEVEGLCDTNGDGTGDPTCTTTQTCTVFKDFGHKGGDTSVSTLAAVQINGLQSICPTLPANTVTGIGTTVEDIANDVNTNLESWINANLGAFGFAAVPNPQIVPNTGGSESPNFMDLTFPTCAPWEFVVENVPTTYNGVNADFDSIRYSFDGTDLTVELLKNGVVVNPTSITNAGNLPQGVPINSCDAVVVNPAFCDTIKMGADFTSNAVGSSTHTLNSFYTGTGPATNLQNIVFTVTDSANVAHTIPNGGTGTGMASGLTTQVTVSGTFSTPDGTCTVTDKIISASHVIQ